MAPPIYLDHHATTPTDPRVVEAMRPYWGDEFGSASSREHAFGRRAEDAVESAREHLAAAIGAGDSREILFTSGATESDNLALKGVLRGAAPGRDHLVTTAIEHAAVLATARALESEGISVSVLPVDGQGCVDPDEVSRAIGPRTGLVSVMAANGEIGTVQPLAEIASLCRRRGVPLHVDAAQAVGRIPLNVARLGVDLLSFSAHKLYGPKGVGALYVRRQRPPLPLAPLLHGGGQERGLRAGTVPVPLIVGFARALELSLADLGPESERLAKLRDRLWEQLRERISGASLNGAPIERLPGNLNVSFEGVEAASLLRGLPGIALSTGSACASGSREPSHVLLALGLSGPLARAGVRFGIGRGNTPEEIDLVAERLACCVDELRGGSRAAPRYLGSAIPGRSSA